MDWQTFVTGFSILLAEEHAAMVWWLEKGVPMWQNFLIVASWTSFTMIVLYFFTEAINKFLEKKFPFIAKFQNWFQNGSQKKNHSEKKFLRLAKKHKGWGLFIFALIPVPLFGVTSTITAEVIKVKYGLLILLAANSLRVAVTAAFFYGFFHLILSFF